jgi:hypothetical protein
MKRSPQLKLLKNQKSSYGGELFRTRRGRSTPRPLDTRNTMHLVLRSSKAVGEWSFKRPKNERRIQEITDRFSEKYGVRIMSIGNVGNHLHFQIKLGSRFTYRPFIRAITAAIAMAVTGASRWNRLESILTHKADLSTARSESGEKALQTNRFWDYRPFTRVIQSYRALLNLKDYIEINQLEGFGVNRSTARFIVADSKTRPWKYRAESG